MHCRYWAHDNQGKSTQMPSRVVAAQGKIRPGSSANKRALKSLGCGLGILSQIAIHA